VRVLGDRAHLVHGVEGTELGRLRDAHRERLRAVLVAPAPGLAVDEVGRELAVRCRHREQLEAADALRGSALVGVDVGGGRGDDRSPAGQDARERRDVGPGAVEYGEGLGLIAEVLLHDVPEPGRVDVFAVRDLVAAIGLGDRRDHFGVGAGVVV
jgi:hypothetical protein